MWLLRAAPRFDIGQRNLFSDAMAQFFLRVYVYLTLVVGGGAFFDVRTNFLHSRESAHLSRAVVGGVANYCPGVVNHDPGLTS